MLAPIRQFSRAITRSVAPRNIAGVRMFATETEKTTTENAEKPVEEAAPFVVDENEVNRLREAIKNSEANVVDFTERLEKAKNLANHEANRFQRELDAERNYGFSKYATAVVDIADTLEMALRHTDAEKHTPEDFANVVAGLQSTQKVLASHMERFRQ